MQRFLSTHTFGGQLAATALGAALVLAASFWVPVSVVRGFGAFGATIAVLLGVLAIVADTFMARRLVLLEDAHEPSALAFPPPELWMRQPEMD